MHKSCPPPNEGPRVAAQSIVCDTPPVASGYFVGGIWWGLLSVKRKEPGACLEELLESQERAAYPPKRCPEELLNSTIVGPCQMIESCLLLFRFLLLISSICIWYIN